MTYSLAEGKSNSCRSENLIDCKACHQELRNTRDFFWTMDRDSSNSVATRFAFSRDGQYQMHGREMSKSTAMKMHFSDERGIIALESTCATPHGLVYR
jgi:hypothetical protein